MGFTVRKGSEKGSLKGGCQKVPTTPPRRVQPLRRVPYITRRRSPNEFENNFGSETPPPTLPNRIPKTFWLPSYSKLLPF